MGHSFCFIIIMATRYLEAMQCLNLIAPERLAEALRRAVIRAWRKSFFPFQMTNFAGSESCCARWQKGMSVKRVALLSYRNLNLPRLLMR